MDPRQLIEQGMAALARRDMATAAAALRTAAESGSQGMPWPALAQAELALGETARAEAAIDRQLALATRDVGALFVKGHLRQRAQDGRAASAFYRAALAQAAVSGTPRGLEGLAAQARAWLAEADRAFTDHLAAHMAPERAGPLSPAMEEALGLLAGTREIDLQRPSMFYYPGLPQRRFYDPAQFPWLAPILAAVPAMQRELEAVEGPDAAAFAPYVTAGTNRPAPNNPLLFDPAWGAFHFWKDGAPVEEAAARCPATMAVLEHAPMPRIPGRAPGALWSRLAPGTHIAPHHGLLNTRLICHVPIRTAPGCTLRVGSETRTWEPGVPLVFDDSIEHEARNAGDAARVVLLFEIWRPEIPEEDRAAITRLIAAIDAYDGGGDS